MHVIIGNYTIWNLDYAMIRLQKWSLIFWTCRGLTESMRDFIFQSMHLGCTGKMLHLWTWFQWFPNSMLAFCFCMNTLFQEKIRERRCGGCVEVVWKFARSMPRSEHKIQSTRAARRMMECHPRRRSRLSLRSFYIQSYLAESPQPPCGNW